MYTRGYLLLYNGGQNESLKPKVEMKFGLPFNPSSDFNFAFPDWMRAWTTFESHTEGSPINLSVSGICLIWRPGFGILSKTGERFGIENDYRDYGIERKYGSGWRDWGRLLGNLRRVYTSPALTGIHWKAKSIPANYFRVIYVRFSSCHEQNFRTFPTIFRRLPNVAANVRRCSDNDDI